MKASLEEIKTHIQEKLALAATRKNLDIDQLKENENFFEFGILDSLGFLELVASVEERFGLEVDFSEADPAEFTHLNGLALLCHQAQSTR